MKTGAGSDETDRKSQERAFRNRTTILAIVLVGIFISVLDIQIVAIALPTITHILNAPLGQTQWIATSYVITVLASVLIFGKLSASVGNGRLFKAGLLLFTISSCACGLSTTLPELIFFRVLQALGSSMLMSISIALILQVFPPGERGRAMGFSTAVIALGLISGPSAGGVIVDTIGWPFIFFVNIPIGIALLIGSAHYLTFDRRHIESHYQDFAGTVLLVVLMGTLAMAFNTLENPPLQILQFAIWFIIFLAALILFIARERSIPEPLLDIAMLTDRRFILPATSLVLYLLATFVLLTAQPFYFEGVMNLRPSHIGLIALITPAAMILCAPLFGWVYDRFPWRGYTFTGLLVMGGAFIACGVAFSHVDFLLIILSFVITGIARSIFQGPNSIEIMAALPSSMQGVGSSLITTLQYLGIMFGISLTTILLTTGLADAGYSGPILEAGSPLLAGIFGQIMIVAGIICLAGAVCSWRR